MIQSKVAKGPALQTKAGKNPMRTAVMLMCVLTAVIVVAICSKSSFLYPLNDWQDTNCYLTVGKSIWSGVVPYRDLFEQKGPFLYFLYAFASLISYRTFFGVYLLEVFCCTFFLYYSYKIVEMYSGKKALYYLPFLAVAVYTSRAFVHGGSAEEICFPILSMSLYYFLKAAKASIKEGFHLSFVNPYYDGEIMPDAVRKAMRPGIGFVSVMTANNETGVLNDVNTICGHCHNNGALFHTDAVQAAGTEDLREIHCDFMTVSSHKIHGPKGVGALFAADPSMLVPLIYGGAEQEHGLRGGTENVAGIVGFGKACELAAKHRAENREKLKTLRNAFVRTLKLDLAYGDFYVNGVCAQRTPKVLSLLFPGIDAQTLLLALDSCGVCVSAGSACTAHESQPSHVLTAMHLNEEEARSTVRVSFSADNTGEEVVRAAHTVASAVKLLRHMDT